MRLAPALVIATALSFSGMAISSANADAGSAAVTVKSGSGSGSGSGGGGVDSELVKACKDTAKQALSQAKNNVTSDHKAAKAEARAKYRAAIAPLKVVRDAVLDDPDSSAAERAAALARYEEDRAPFKAELRSAKKAAQVAHKTAKSQAKATYKAAEVLCKN